MRVERNVRRRRKQQRRQQREQNPSVAPRAAAPLSLGLFPISLLLERRERFEKTSSVVDEEKRSRER